jgi:hypothetical protein
VSDWYPLPSGIGVADIDELGIYNTADYIETVDDGDYMLAVARAIAASQSATNEGGIIWTPPGKRNALSELPPSILQSTTGKGIFFMGAGGGLNEFDSVAQISEWHFPSDLGAGTYALFGTEPFFVLGVMGICFSGNGAPAKGQLNYAMEGVSFGSQAIIDDVVVTKGFHSGFVPCGNHANVTNFRADGNYYGLWYKKANQQSQGSGNNHFQNGVISGNSAASIGCEYQWGVYGELFTEVHMGFGPVGILQEPGASVLVNFVVNCTFDNSAIEAWGDAAIWSQGGSAGSPSGVGFGLVNNNHWGYNTTPTHEAQYINLGVQEAWLMVYQFLGNHWHLGDLVNYPEYASGTTYHLYVSNLGEGNRFSMTSSNSGGYNILSSVPFFGGVWSEGNSYTDTGTLVTGRPLRVTQSVSAGQVLEFSATSQQVQIATTGGTSPLAGVAGQFASNGQYVICYYTGLLNQPSGSTSTPLVLGDGTIAANTSVTPNRAATNGRIVQATYTSDRILGYTVGPGADGVGTPIFIQILNSPTFSGAIATQPAASSSTALVEGTAFQNTLGYDIVLVVYLNITANTSGVVALGVGPTSTPSQQTIITGTTSLGIVPVTIYLPANYYALLSVSGTITQSIVGQLAMPV